jgi:hypothetical protein
MRRRQTPMNFMDWAGNVIQSRNQKVTTLPKVRKLLNFVDVRRCGGKASPKVE